MPQIKPIADRRASTINALPFNVVKGFKPTPFVLRFTGLWNYIPKMDAWRPKMLTPKIRKGTNGDTDQQIGSAIVAAGDKHRMVQVFAKGDRRLGRYSEFYLRWPVHMSGNIIASHFGLASETYHKDSLGRIVRKVNQEWLEGLFTHVVKTGLILPPLRSDLDAAVSRVSGQITVIDERMTVRGAARDELEIRRAQLVTLREKMIASFEKQFPDADKLSDDLEDVEFGNEDGFADLSDHEPPM